MIDLGTTIKSLRLAWLKRIFSENDGTWENYLHHILESFYTELLQWWALFRDDCTKKNKTLDQFIKKWGTFCPM